MIETMDEIGVLEEVTISIIGLPARPEEIAYIIPDIGFAGEGFEIYRRESGAGVDAWWMVKDRMMNLIKGFQIGLTVKDALAFAHISKTQYMRFREVHPDWDDVKDMLAATPVTQSMLVLNEELLKGNVKVATMFATRRNALLATKATPEDEPLQPTITQNNTNNIIINADAEARVIQDAIRAVAIEVFGNRRAARKDYVGAAPVVAGGTEE